MKALKNILLLPGVLILFMAALPIKNSMPTELKAIIEKKWPGSSTILVSRQRDSDKNTILYEIRQDNTTAGWAYTRRVLSCRSGGCDGQNLMAEESISHEYFDYYALLNTENSILEIKVYNYAATHGQEICSKAWLKQFKGYNGNKQLRYGKDIDAISGATISGRAITEDVGATVALLKRQ